MKSKYKNMILPCLASSLFARQQANKKNFGRMILRFVAVGKTKICREVERSETDELNGKE